MHACRAECNNNKLDNLIGEEILGRQVVLCFGIVNGTMRGRLRSGWVFRCWSTLEKRTYLQVRIGQHVGQVEDFCRATVAHEAALNGWHVEICSIKL
jgi:hypothetical protein